MQGSIKTATQSRCTDATAQMAVIAQMQRHKWLSLHRCNGTNGCQCTDATTLTVDDLHGGFAPQPRLGLLCGINGGYRPKSKQGCLQSATQSRYARMHKDSHTKPLHDATAQMAVIAQMQRHKWLSLHRCNGTNGCHCTDAMAQMAVIAQMQWHKWLSMHRRNDTNG